MSNQLRFEGSELEALLTQVRTEIGEDARIVAANRVRKGGVGGFFAKEVYEVVVETDAAASESDDRRMRPAARLGRKRAQAANSMTGSTMTGSTMTGTTMTVDRSPASVLDLVDAVDAAEQMASDAPHGSVIDLSGLERADQPMLSTQGDDFAAMLQRLTDDGDVAVGPAEAAVPMPETPKRAARVPRVWEAAARGEDRVDMAPTMPAAETTMSVPASAPHRDDEREIEVIEVAATPLPSAPRAPRVRPHREPIIEPVEASEFLERPEAVLATLGLPPRMIPRGKSGSALRGALVEALADLPEVETLPRARGVAVAVVGIGARPVALARILAAEHGVDPDSVVVARTDVHPDIPEWLQIHDGATAQERRRSWRRREELSFVAVSLPSIATGTEWANDLLDGLEPTQIWAVAHAGWKPDDVAAWSRRLGGFDALALERADDTISPAAMLATGIPVARIDAEPTSAEAWADLLCDRIVVA